MQVTLLERRPIVGGMCVTEELFPGCKVSSLACRHGMLRRKITEDLNLESHGLKTYRGNYASHIFTDGSSLTMDFATREGAITSTENDLTPADLAGWNAFWTEIGIASKILSQQQENTSFTQASYQQMLHDAGAPLLAHHLYTDTLFTYVSRRITNPKLMACACASNFSHAHQPGSLFEMIYLDTAESFAEFGQWGYAVGGMGAVTQALLAEATRLGVTVVTNAEVTHIEPSPAGHVVHTLTSSYAADVVLAATDPYTLYRKILHDHALPQNLLAQVDAAVEDISKAILHIRLKALPQIPTLNASGRNASNLFHGQIDFTLTPEQLNTSWQGFNTSGTFDTSINLATNMLTAMDSSLTSGSHVWTIVHFFCPTHYKGGDWTEEGRQQLLADTLAIIRPHVPGLDTLIEDTHLITPTDLRDRYGLHTFTPVHVSYDTHVLENRPFAGYNGYTTPITGIYLCSSATNPGAMVTGMPGYLCAQQVLKEYA